MLELGQIELAFINIPLIAPDESLAIEPLFKFEASVFVANDHPLAVNSPPSNQALSEAKWAVVDKPHAIELFDALFLAEGLPAPHIAVRTNSLMLIRALIVNCGFVGVLPNHLLRRGLEHRVKRLDVPSTPLVRDAGLITRREGFHRPVADELAETIRQNCRRMVSA